MGDDDEDEEEGSDGVVKEAAERKDDDASSSSSSYSSSDDSDAPPIDAAVYAFVPPAAPPTQPSGKPAQTASSASAVRTAPRPAPGPPSLRDQSLLVVAQQAARGGDELDQLLAMHDDAIPTMRTQHTALAQPRTQPASKAQAELAALETDLDDLLNLG